jgi:antitoxin CcdA
MFMTISKSPRKPRATNVSLDGRLLDEAKSLGINVSQACESGLIENLKKARAEKWLEENLEAMQSWAKYIKENGLPFAEYRQV